MTLLEIRSLAAAYLGKTLTDLTVNGYDLGLSALNQARLTAELQHNFEFSRKLVTVSVNGVTGGSLDTAVEYGTATLAPVKSVVDVGLFDDNGNLRATDWTTVGAGLGTQRSERPFWMRYPTDGEAVSGLTGSKRFVFEANKVFFYPKDSTATFTLGIEAYTFTSDWTATATNETVVITGATGVTGVNATYYHYSSYGGKALFLNISPSGAAPVTLYAIWYNSTKWMVTLASEIGVTVPTNYHSLTSSAEAPDGSYTGHGSFTGTAVAASAYVTDIWTTRASQYLQWATVVQLNNYFKEFVPRQEGNLPPPSQLAQEGLQSLIQWDIFNYEQFRRHE